MKILLPALAIICCLTTGFAQSSVTRTVDSFNAVAISGGFDKVILQEGNTEKVTIEVSGIDPDKITTEVKNGTLGIGMKKGSWNNYKGILTITYRNLNNISNSGSSDVEFRSVLKADKFSYHSSGSGDLKGSFDVRQLEVAISGSSDMVLKGSADKQEYAISGSGDVDAHQLSGKSAEVGISGSGDVKLNIDGPVRSSISGSGEVTNNK